MIKNYFLGKFIVLEGLDGSGKDAQIELLISYLKENGKEVISTKEPTMESDAGRKIKQALKKEIEVDSMRLQKLFVEDRELHLKNKIIPALKDGKFVVSSRYAFSTLAYGYADGLNVDLLAGMNDNFLLPDLTIIIDVSPEFCVRRLESRGQEKELFEKITKLTKAREIYKKIPEMFENVILVNGEGAVQEVFSAIKKLIKNIL